MKINRSLMLTALAVSSAVLVLMCSVSPAGCSEREKLKVIATLFPQYDFTRQIAGNRADVRLLLPPGSESHTYEPSPSDIIRIDKADMFIYTGRNMEHWADKIISSVKSEKIMAVDVSKGIKLIRHEDEEHEGKQHQHVFDPHIWTDPANAVIMADNILSSLCAARPEEAEYFRENAKKFKRELKKLDKEFSDAVSSGSRKKIVFGGRNAFAYFLRRYGLESVSASDFCSTQADPGVKRIAEIIRDVRKEKIPVIYYGELVLPKTAKTISEETGVRLLPLNSCHNLSAEDMKKGKTYLSIMRENLFNLKEGLK